MYDPFDPDFQKTMGIIFIVFILALVFMFITLKLLAIITWSWWGVWAPLWVPFAFGLVMSLLGIKPPGQ